MNFKRVLKKICLWLVIGIIVSLLSHFIIELIYFNFNYERVFIEIFERRFELYILGSIILFIIYGLFSSIAGSSVVGGIILVLISFVFGAATRLKANFRAEPLFPNELYMIKELPFLFEMIGNRKTIMIVSAILMTVVSIFLYYKFRKKLNRDYSINNLYTFRGIGTIVSLFLLIYVGRFNHPNNLVKTIYSEYAHWIPYHQVKNYTDNGFIAGYLSNMRAPAMTMPENYTKEKINEIINKYQMKAEEINQSRLNDSLDVNIIFVMNESFSDPSNIIGVESNKDPLPNYRDIIKNAFRGYNKAPSIGGGTATSEFQVLTGFSMEPFDPHITSPYIQLVSQISNFPLITNQAKKYGFKTTAIHPYDSTFYRRNDVYSNMSFDEFRHDKNMVNREKISENHRYISDFSAYMEVFDVMNESPEKDFIHLVTMQNHMTYSNKYDSTGYDVKGTGNASEANAYFKDLENSDISLRLLINKIEAESEPILLIFWGDHLPSFYEGEILEQNSALTMYEAPFFIYSNQENLDGEIELISPIFFANYIGKILDLKVTPYEALLLELEEKLPVLDNGIYYDNHKKEWVNNREDLSPDTLEVLQEYSFILYDIVNGNGLALENNFF